MNHDTVEGMFSKLAVHTLADAHDMLSIVTVVARGTYSFRVAAAFGKLSVADLTLQACEGSSILKSVRTFLDLHPRQRGADKKAAEWVLKRLPGDLDGLKAMAKSLRISHRKGQLHDGGDDPQSAAAVATAWCKQNPPELEASMWHAMLGEAPSPWQLPSAACETCGGFVGPSGRNRRNLCESCKADARKVWDAERQRKRRRCM
jgi:hypothetical protein